MKKNFLLIFVIFLFINCQQNGQPKISVNQEKFDFGNIQEAAVVAHDFVIKNIGNEKLVIEKVRASCGCTAAKPDKNELAPGDSTKIKVTFNSRNRNGVQRKYVYIFSNDPKNPQLRLYFTTNVLKKEEFNTGAKAFPHLVLSTNEHDFGTLKSGEIVNYVVTLRNTGTAVLKINDIRTSCGCTAALLSDKEIKPGNLSKLEIKLDTSGRSGEMTRTVTLFTNDPKKPDQTIVIYAKVLEGKS